VNAAGCIHTPSTFAMLPPQNQVAGSERQVI
jgi:hypothetical protein